MGYSWKGTVTVYDTKCIWDTLEKTDKPILLYGMGNGAEKVLDQLSKRKIKVSGVFANDEFVRGQEFCGFKVLTYQEAKEKFGDMVVLLCFGTHLGYVINRIKEIGSEQEIYAPDVPVAGNGVFDGLFYDLHQDEIKRAKSCLSDFKSQTVFDEIIKYKLDGKIEHLLNCESPDDENWSLLNLGDEESYLDIGAYNGDTIRYFLEIVKGYKKILAVEPEPHSFKKLSKMAENLENVTLFPVAIGKEKGTGLFDIGNGRGSSLGKGKPIDIDCIDSIAGADGVSFIKIDSEGQEADAIEGGRKTIENFAPKMLIAAYHRPEDIFDIPLRVLNINGNYDVFLRRSPCLPAWEINYYFVPKI